MPNTPVAIRHGVTGLCSDSDDPVARLKVERLMAALGRVEWFEDEGLFSVAGAITAAGPAFLFRFIDALTAAGEALGLEPGLASRLAKAMVEGAGALAAVSEECPAELARRVASPRGTTEAGLAVLDGENGLRDLILRTLEAARRRGAEMAEAARGAPD
jgi:pyrroline-5-carboxylate reductase